MPSPIGHALGGLICGLALLRSPLVKTRTPFAPHAGGPTLWRIEPMPTRALWACALVACLPDVDFFWDRHNFETHSLGAAALAGLAVLAWTRGRDWRLALACALGVASHVLFDYLGSDDREPLGVMALWPYSTEMYFGYAYIFEAISRRYWLPNFIPHNTWAVAREVLLLAPAALALYLWRSRGVSSKFEL